MRSQMPYRSTSNQNSPGHGHVMVKSHPRWIRPLFQCFVLVALLGTQAKAKEPAHTWTRSKEFDETSFTETLDSKVRIHVNAPLDAAGQAARATRLIVYTLPAGNTIEQTLGCKA